LVTIVAIGSNWFGRAPLAQRLLQPMVEGSARLPRALWLRLNWIWAGFYLLLGGLNLWIAYSASERVWVNFKFFGLTSAFMLFALLQAFWLSARLQAAPAPLA
jgi:intracellular septation protein